MIDRSFRLTFRNFSTLFLIAAVVTLPVYLGYGFFFRNVIALRELHPSIEGLGGARRIGGIGKANLEQARWVAWALWALLLLTLPLLVRAARRALERDASGHAPTVTDAFSRPPDTKTSLSQAVRRNTPAVLAALGAGIAVGWPIERIGIGLSELLPRSYAWTVVGLGQGASRAAGLAFLLVPLALKPGDQRPAKRSSSGTEVSTEEVTSV